VTVHEEKPLLLPTLFEHRYRATANPYLAAASKLGLPAIILRSLIPAREADIAPSVASVRQLREGRNA
jgi:hypothetical protein